MDLQTQRDIEWLQSLQRQFSPITETYQALCRAIEALQKQPAQKESEQSAVTGEHCREPK